MPTIEEVVAKYVSLRDRKAEIAKRQQEELAPIGEAMLNIEAWLLNRMNELGVENLKTASGTPYKANSNSVKLSDPLAFKAYVFLPALEAIHHYLNAVGHSLQPADLESLQSCLQEKIKWDMVDFRAGKKGILEYVENNGVTPPGVQIETTTVINVRRA